MATQPEPKLVERVVRQRRTLLIGTAAFFGVTVGVEAISLAVDPLRRIPGWPDLLVLAMVLLTFHAAILGVVFLVASLAVWRCPACRHWLGLRLHPTTCPGCGVPLTRSPPSQA